MKEIVIEKTISEDQLKQLLFKPAPPRSWLVRKIRQWIGLQDDVEKGELFEKLLMSNLRRQRELTEGIRRDFNAANEMQNPVNGVVIELQQRLAFYEHHNDSLHPTWRKYLREMERIRVAAETQAANEAREAAKLEIKNHLPEGEVIDCTECGGSSEVTFEEKGRLRKEICDKCKGSGVELNPNHVPPVEESNASDETVTGPQLVTD